MQFHAKTVKETLEYFGVELHSGVVSENVKKMQDKYGRNELIAQKNKPAWLLFLEQFNDPFIYILIVAAILNGILAEPKDTIVIAAVVILNTLIGFIQEQKASDALKALQKMSAPEARVIRDGKMLTIPSAEVVCGDILVLESGVRTPADARLIDSLNLLVDESMLTGESFAINKQAAKVVDLKSPLGDRTNMVYSGTIVQKGRGTAVVTAVGRGTEFGKISEKVAEAEETVSPLQAMMEKFSKYLSIAIVSCVAIIFVIGYFKGNDILQMFLTSVALAVSAIPEGLLVAVTITLSIGLYQMAKRGAIVKKLAAVESLGSTNVICTDKTGTLTKNQMTLTAFCISGKIFEVEGSGYHKAGKVSIDGKNMKYDSEPALRVFSLISKYCTESEISDNGEEWAVEGDPTEAALQIGADKLQMPDMDIEKVIDIPFESELQLMAVSVRHEGKRYLLAKGAVEKIFERCKNGLALDGTAQDVNTDILWNEVYSLSERGLRVLALAYKEIDNDEEVILDSLTNMTFVGIAGIQDAVRPEACQAVDECHSAHVKVVMITGDHAKTAQAVAKAVGIGHLKEEPLAVTGQEIDEMSDNELFEKAPNIDVYARVAPHHKYRIVKTLQSHSQIVAMTGDGVNDAPALKQADIGVAMGSGTDVAKEASHMVLTDDNFASIVKAIRRGRIVLHNLQHIILYILSTSFGGLLTIASSVIMGLPLPILPAQILWINLVTDGTSTFPLAFEKEHGNVMIYPPRKKRKGIVSRRMLFRVVLAGSIMAIGTIYAFHVSAEDIYNATGMELAKAQTIAFCVLAFFQIWNVQNSRSVNRSLFFNIPIEFPGQKDKSMDRISPFKNPILLGVMLLAIVLQVSAVALPFMNTLLDTVPLTMHEWLFVMGLTFGIIIIVEATKLIFAVVNKFKMKKMSVEEAVDMIR